MELNKLSKITTKKKKRIGRGIGSGKGGHTVGRGQKGEKSRSNFRRLKSWVRESKIRSLPKLKGIGKRSSLRGYFKEKVNNIVLNITDLDRVYKNNDIVSKKTLITKGLVDKKNQKMSIKLLGIGEIKKKLVLKGIHLSESAKKKIIKAKGKVI